MARQRRFVALALALVASTDALDTIRSHLRKVPEATATADGAEFKGLVEARLEGESLQHTSAGAKHLLFGQEYACEKEVADLKAEIEKLKQKCGPTPVPTVSPTVFEKCPLSWNSHFRHGLAHLGHRAGLRGSEFELVH